MDQERTPEDPHARFTRKMTEALHELTDAEGMAPGLVMTEWVILGAAQGWDEDGEDVTQIVVEPHGPESRVLGLIEHARQRMHAEIASAYTGFYTTGDDD